MAMGRKENASGGAASTFDEIRHGELAEIASTRSMGPPDLAARPRRAPAGAGRPAADDVSTDAAGDTDATRDRPGEPGAPADAGPGAAPAVADGPVGLALSGGGIRSATFSLGVLQAIAANGSLPRIDYLSSVSGGGYIASWLSAWIARTSLDSVAAKLSQSPETREREPNEVLWLRRYSNYLTPRVGALSLDALTVVSTWLRNVLLNLIILVFSVSAVLALPIAILPVVAALTGVSTWCALIALGFALWSLSFVAINLTVKCPRPKGSAGFVLSSGGVLCLVVLPALAASFFGGIWLVHPPAANMPWWESTGIGLLAFYAVVGVAWAIGFRVAARCARDTAANAAPQMPASGNFNARDAFVYALCAAASTLVGAGLLIVLKLLFDRAMPALKAVGALALGDASTHEAAAIFLFAPAGILLCLGTATCIFIGLVGRNYAEASREWFARTGGAFMLTSLIWITWLGLAFYVPSMVEWTQAWLAKTAFVTWLGSLIGSVILTRVRGRQKAEQGSGFTTILATVLASVVACGIFVLIAIGLHQVLDILSSFLPRPSSPGNGTGWPSVAALFVIGATLVALLFAWRVDINRFSLHDMYKNRLIRCYLGASNPLRAPQPFVGFDSRDDLPLTQLPARPHHIINTALNLVQGSELAWQERKAASFVFMRNYCGFQLSRAQGNAPVRDSATPAPGMQPTAEYASIDPDSNWKGITLGIAMATSGAAVSPNMGFHSQPALAALMTFFNLRLGRWCPNPAASSWKKSSPKFGLRYLLAELTGHTNESSRFVYLSDGGHFENTAVYELVRRRCARILVVDVGADPTRAFEDLANMMRKCRVDLGVDFELDATPLYADGDGYRSKSGFVDGTIFYGATGNSPAFEGRILVIKPSLQTPPAETTDVYSYGKRATTFPQQTTVDQWFDESQFESYRKLGYCLAGNALAKHPGFFS